MSTALVEREIERFLASPDPEVLCLRGENSDLLLAPYAEEMTRRGPRCRLVTIKGCGHTPSLNVPEQINLVADFLQKGF